MCAFNTIDSSYVLVGRHDITLTDFACEICHKSRSGCDPGVYLTSTTFPGQCTTGKATYVFGVDLLQYALATRLLQPRSSRSGQLAILNAVGDKFGRTVSGMEFEMLIHRRTTSTKVFKRVLDEYTRMTTHIRAQQLSVNLLSCVQRPYRWVDCTLFQVSHDLDLLDWN